MDSLARPLSRGRITTFPGAEVSFAWACAAARLDPRNEKGGPSRGLLDRNAFAPRYVRYMRA